MPVYVAEAHRITDCGKLEEYNSKVGPMVTKYGGRYLTRGDNLKMPKGGHWIPERVVIIEFPDMRRSMLGTRRPGTSLLLRFANLAQVLRT
jgi:uncharacterized protein (DUF1330 family)